MSILEEKLAGGRIKSNRERAREKKMKDFARKKEERRLKEAGLVEARRATIKDLAPVRSPDPGSRSRVSHGGFMAPAVELNSLRPLQVGHTLNGVEGRADWLIRSHPVMLVRVEDLDVWTDNITGEQRAAAQVIISNPFLSEYVDNELFVSQRGFNQAYNAASPDPACMCFYGETEVPNATPPTLGDGTVLAPGIYNEEQENENLLQCNNPKTLNATNFILKGRLVVMPHPTAVFTEFRIFVRNSAGSPVRVYTQHIASRTLFGPNSRVYGGTDVRFNPHVIEGHTYWHDIKQDSAGGGFLSDHDGRDTASVERRSDHIGRGAGPAIVDLHVLYPLQEIVTPQGLATRDAWGTRLR